MRATRSMSSAVQRGALQAPAPISRVTRSSCRVYATSEQGRPSGGAGRQAPGSSDDASGPSTFKDDFTEDNRGLQGIAFERPSGGGSRGYESPGFQSLDIPSPYGSIDVSRPSGGAGRTIDMAGANDVKAPASDPSGSRPGGGASRGSTEPLLAGAGGDGNGGSARGFGGDDDSLSFGVVAPWFLLWTGIVAGAYLYNQHFVSSKAAAAPTPVKPCCTVKAAAGTKAGKK